MGVVRVTRVLVCLSAAQDELAHPFRWLDIRTICQRPHLVQPIKKKKNLKNALDTRSVIDE